MSDQELSLPAGCDLSWLDIQGKVQKLSTALLVWPHLLPVSLFSAFPTQMLCIFHMKPYEFYLETCVFFSLSFAPFSIKDLKQAKIYTKSMRSSLPTQLEAVLHPFVTYYT